MHRILTPDCFVGVVFTKPTGPFWPEVQEILQHAAQLSHAAAFVDTLPGKITIAGFDQKPLHAQTLRQLLIRTAGWKKTATFYLRGVRKINPKKMGAWAKCYAESRLAANLTAYCSHVLPIFQPLASLKAAGLGDKIIHRSGGGIEVSVADYFDFHVPDLKKTLPPGYWKDGIYYLAVPRNLPQAEWFLPCRCRKNFLPELFLNYDPAISFADQYQAWAVRSDVATCPNFFMENFRVVKSGASEAPEKT